MEFNNYMSLQLPSTSVQTYFRTHPRTTQIICFPISQIQCFLWTEGLWKWKSTLWWWICCVSWFGWRELRMAGKEGERWALAVTLKPRAVVGLWLVPSAFLFQVSPRKRDPLESWRTHVKRLDPSVMLAYPLLPSGPSECIERYQWRILTNSRVCLLKH